MSLLAAALAIWLAGGFASLCAGSRRRLATRIGVGTAVAGSTLALAGVQRLLFGGGAAETVMLPWAMPLASHLSCSLDSLSAVFVALTALLTALAAIYGAGYLRHAPANQPPAVSWGLFNLLTASMTGVFVAANVLFFLLAWECMSLASFGLVLSEHDRPDVRRAGLIYFVATHLGTALLLVMFLLLGRETGSLDFSTFHALRTPGLAGTLFLLAVAGFGTKAGFMPFHVWLPEAHPAAPSHVSAVMSGIMIKTGLYGLLRTILWLGPPPFWWGGLLIAIGALSGVLGILLALAQQDLKRLLAYSSVENMGIMTLGFGLGLVGLASHHPTAAVLGFAGGLFHAANHAFVKSLLFFSAGSILHATGTRTIDRLGGLLKTMPVTGAAFLTGAAAICGLPPLNGFISELLIFAAAFQLLAGATLPVAVAALTAIVSLALIGGLAVACFAKAFGAAFLGEPRRPLPAPVHEAGPCMRAPMLALAGLCFLIAAAAPTTLRLLAPAAQLYLGDAAPAAWVDLVSMPLAIVACAGACLLGLTALLLALRRFLLSGRSVTASVTWDCGYAAPTARMQVTASSFAQPLLWVMRYVLLARRRFSSPRGLFPAEAACASETPDIYQDRFYRPLFAAVEKALARLSWLQHGKLNLYILAIVLALLVLLFWKMR